MVRRPHFDHSQDRGSLDENSGSGARFPVSLNWVELPLVDLDTCNSVSTPGYEVKVERMFSDIQVNSDYLCAGYLHHDACQGDSGGPLFLKKDDWDVVVHKFSCDSHDK